MISDAAKLLTKDEARRIAANIARIKGENRTAKLLLCRTYKCGSNPLPMNLIGRQDVI